MWKEKDWTSFFMLCDNEPSRLSRGRTVTAKRQVKGGGELNIRAFSMEAEDCRKREDSEEDQEETLELTGWIINSGCTWHLLPSFILTRQLRGFQYTYTCWDNVQLNNGFASFFASQGLFPWFLIFNTCLQTQQRLLTTGFYQLWQLQQQWLFLLRLDLGLLEQTSQFFIRKKHKV